MHLRGQTTSFQARLEIMEQAKELYASVKRTGNDMSRALLYSKEPQGREFPPVARLSAEVKSH